MLDDDRLQYLIQQKDNLEEPTTTEGWAIIDNCLVIYDHEDPPHWFPSERTEDGNTPEFEAREGVS